jgi:hypothetical protein
MLCNSFECRLDLTIGVGSQDMNLQAATSASAQLF